MLLYEFGLRLRPTAPKAGLLHGFGSRTDETVGVIDSAHVLLHHLARTPLDPFALAAYAVVFCLKGERICFMGSPRLAVRYYLDAMAVGEAPDSCTARD